MAFAREANSIDILDAPYHCHWKSDGIVYWLSFHDGKEANIIVIHNKNNLLISSNYIFCLIDMFY